MTVTISQVEALHGKRVAFITSGYAGKRFIYEKAANLGIVATIIDSPQSWAKSLVDEGIIKNFIGVDFGQNSDMVVADILNELRARSIELDGVCTFAELSLPVTAKLAASLHLPGSDPDVVALVRDKHQVRKVVAGAGLSEIRSFAIKSVADLDDAANYVGFPAVLKPISGADSLGVRKVDSLEELEAALSQVQEVVASLVVTSGALCRSPTGPPTSETAGRFIALDLSLEEYLDGPEVDVDIVLHRGECFFAAVVDNGPTREPYFAETWNLCPSLLSSSAQLELIKEALDTVRVLGFTDGVFHVEERMTSRGPRIIEVNARMGGGPIRLQHKYVYGVDLVVEQLLACVGLPPSVHTAIPAEPLHAGRCFVSSTPNATRSGTIRSLDFLTPIRSRPDLIGLWEFVDMNEPVVIGPEHGQPSWLCEVALAGANGPAALLAEMHQLVNTMVADVDAHYYL